MTIDITPITPDDIGNGATQVVATKSLQDYIRLIGIWHYVPECHKYALQDEDGTHRLFVANEYIDWAGVRHGSGYKPYGTNLPRNATPRNGNDNSAMELDGNWVGDNYGRG